MSSYKYIIGIDEVGRGSLAGPVYLTGVKLNLNFPLLTKFHSWKSFKNKYKILEFVRDSKKLTEPKRILTNEIFSNFNQEYITLSCSAELIDHYGIGKCLSYMMHIICAGLYVENCKIIADGKIKILNEFDPNFLEKIFIENNTLDKPKLEKFYFTESNKSEDNLVQKTIVINREPKADDKYLSIAIASNIAKVSRDNYMTEIHKKYPQYGWNQNKGYGTKINCDAIKKHPNNKHLRKTFLSNIIKNKM